MALLGFRMYVTKSAPGVLQPLTTCKVHHLKNAITSAYITLPSHLSLCIFLLRQCEHVLYFQHVAIVSSLFENSCCSTVCKGSDLG